MSQVIESIKNEEAQKEEKKQEEIRIYKNTSRLVGNALEIIADSEFSGREVFAVAEVIQWLTSMKQQVRQELSDRGVDDPTPKLDAPPAEAPKA
jgi:hypothetical protein